MVKYRGCIQVISKYSHHCEHPQILVSTGVQKQLLWILKVFTVKRMDMSLRDLSKPTECCRNLNNGMTEWEY